MHIEERDFAGTASVPVYVMLPVSILLLAFILFYFLLFVYSSFLDLAVE